MNAAWAECTACGVIHMANDYCDPDWPNTVQRFFTR